MFRDMANFTWIKDSKCTKLAWNMYLPHSEEMIRLQTDTSIYNSGNKGRTQWFKDRKK